MAKKKPNLMSVMAQAKSNTDSQAQRKQTNSKVPVAELALGSGSTGLVKTSRVAIIEVAANECRGWSLHNRNAHWYNAERCADLIQSIKSEGQLEPALARKLNDEDGYKYELIYGMRRRFACDQLNIPLKLKIIECDDMQAAIFMHIENEHRADITPMEKALSYKKLNQSGIFSTMENLAKLLNLPKGTLSKYLKASSLFDEPIMAEAFPDPTELPVSKVNKLVDLLTNPSERKVIHKRLQNVKGGLSQFTPIELLNDLIECVKRSTQVDSSPLKEAINVGERTTCTVTRNAKGKVTLAFDTFEELTEDSFKELFVKVEKMLG
ncbi:hypothetical protein N480_25420 [Pseudoalteromonas luteoviolacea S2607]|uniref:ParB/RepB/Spo0J family partition protein n=1 Tax=Pseudoalteromonas luteoviolacea TaxID=43657 RepID=UPI0007B03B41|nr:ParB/RepB/Spo0J family partition protein [Pseudoalteromonas luteoviolacea]KZN32592.1 hypothetical protein N480_25420 [Pseudoalteromonas luteoviolacea S2607]